MGTAGDEDVHAIVGRRLRRARQRYTDGRRSLIGLLARTGRPLTTPEIVDAAPELSQSSVYRNLQVLERVGVVRRLLTAGDAGGARFELAEELTAHHHHLVCSNCGDVQDFQPGPPLEQALSQATSAVGDTGFDTDHHRLDLVGTCVACT